MSNFITRAEFEEFKAQLSQQLCCASQSNPCCDDNGVSNVIYQNGILQVQFENGNVQNYNLPKGVWTDYLNYNLDNVIISGQFSIDNGNTYSPLIDFPLSNIPLLYQPYFENTNLYYKIYEDQHNKVAIVNIALYFIGQTSGFLVKSLVISFAVPINIKQLNYGVFTFNATPNNLQNNESYSLPLLAYGGWIGIGTNQGNVIRELFGNVYINGQITCELA